MRPLEETGVNGPLIAYHRSYDIFLNIFNVFLPDFIYVLISRYQRVVRILVKVLTPAKKRL
jgi:hypothetical protein